MTALGIAGHHDVLLRILFVGLLDLDALVRFHNALAVGNAGAHLEQNRRIKLLGEFVSQLGESQRFAGVARLEHRDLGSAGVVAGVLLVLAGMHAGVICHADDHTGIHARIADGKQRICCHVQSDVLHAAEAALASQARAERSFHGHFLVGRPFGVNLFVFGHLFRDFRGRRAWIAGYERASGLIKTAGNSGVAQHKLFHEWRSLLLCRGL